MHKIKLFVGNKKKEGKDKMNKFMKIAKQNAEKWITNNEGGPFGAIIIDKLGNIISNGNNKVFKEKDDKEEKINA